MNDGANEPENPVSKMAVVILLNQTHRPLAGLGHSGDEVVDLLLHGLLFRRNRHRGKYCGASTRANMP